MEQELFLTGFCRQLNESRRVTVELENAKLLECDCGFGSCIYEPNCTIAQQIQEQLKK